MTSIRATRSVSIRWISGFHHGRAGVPIKTGGEFSRNLRPSCELTFDPIGHHGFRRIIGHQRVKFGDRFPLLVRFRKDAQNGQLAWVMNAGIVSDLVDILPEWAGTEGKARYDGSYEKMAAGELYPLPLDATASICGWIFVSH